VESLNALNACSLEPRTDLRTRFMHITSPRESQGTTCIFTRIEMSLFAVQNPIRRDTFGYPCVAVNPFQYKWAMSH